MLDVDTEIFREDLIDILRLKNKADWAERLEGQALNLFKQKYLTSEELKDAYIAVAEIKAGYEIENERFCSIYGATKEDRDRFPELSASLEPGLSNELKDLQLKDVWALHHIILGDKICRHLDTFKEKPFSDFKMTEEDLKNGGK